QGLLLSERSGRWAAGIEASPITHETTGDYTAGSNSVSCASAGNCTAVHNYITLSPATNKGLLLSERSGRWVAATEASLPADAGTDRFVQLFSVSCASAGNCTAVGIYQDVSSGDFNRHVLLLSETSGAWAAGVEASLPANASTN